MKKLVLLTAGMTALAGATGARELWACAAFLWSVLWMVVPDWHRRRMGAANIRWTAPGHECLLASFLYR